MELSIGGPDSVCQEIVRMSPDLTFKRRGQLLPLSETQRLELAALVWEYRDVSRQLSYLEQSMRDWPETYRDSEWHSEYLRDNEYRNDSLFAQIRATVDLFTAGGG